MKKAIYDLTSKNNSDLRKADLTGTGCKTVSELKISVTAAREEIDAKRYNRKSIRDHRTHETHETTIKHRMMILRGKRIEDFVYVMAGKPTHTTDTIIYKSPYLRIEFYAQTDYEMYAKSYYHPGIRYTLEIGVPDGPVHLSMIDGILTEILHSHDIGNGIVVSSCTIWSHRGFNVTSKPGVVAQRGKVSYHAATVTQAVKGLERKEKASAGKTITADTVVTKKLYQQITGACDAGMAAFQQAHNLPDQMKASDLIQVLRTERAYGVNTFSAAMR